VRRREFGKAVPDDVIDSAPRRKSAARLRGDRAGGCSAGDTVYTEQHAAFQLAKGGPTGITPNVTLTRAAVVKF